jgi:anti-sigma factor RsiW
MADLSHKCEQIILLLDSYHDSESSPDERAMVESHLGPCADCRKRLSDIGTLVATLKTMPEIKATVDFADRVEQMILRSEKSTASDEAKVEAKGAESTVIRFGKAAWLSAAAAVALLALLVSQFFVQAPTVDVASRSSTNNNVQPSNPDKNEIAAAVGDNTQVSPRKEQPANVAPPKTEKMNDQASRAHKIAGQKVRIAQDTNTLDVANRPDNVDATEAKGSETAANMVANNEPQDNSQAQSLVAFSEPESNNIAEELGITTDEDGLYAIKL